jgi:hypothetical protein
LDGGGDQPFTNLLMHLGRYLSRRAQLRNHFMKWKWLEARAVAALERLAWLNGKRDLRKRVLWPPDTARRWLKKIAKVER